MPQEHAHELMNIHNCATQWYPVYHIEPNIL